MTMDRVPAMYCTGLIYMSMICSQGMYVIGCPKSSAFFFPPLFSTGFRVMSPTFESLITHKLLKIEIKFLHQLKEETLQFYRRYVPVF